RRSRGIPARRNTSPRRASRCDADARAGTREPRMTINHIFLAFMVLVGAAVGIVLVIHPESRDFRLSPYFWVLIAMAAFELITFARGRGAPGTVVSMDARLAGCVLAIVAMVSIPTAAGRRARFF